VRAGPLHLDVPDLTTLDPKAALFSAIALILVFGLRIGVLKVMAGCALGGLVLRLAL
jgi:chromate transporter